MTLSRTPSLPGSSGQDSPNLTGWGIAAYQDFQEIDMSSESDIPLFERLRRDTEPPAFAEFEVPEEARRSFYKAMGSWIEDGAHGFYLPPDSGDGHCSPERFTETIARRMSELSNAYNGKQTQSPIEDMMLGALLWLDIDWAGLPRFDMLNGPKDPSWKGMEGPGVIFNLAAQADLAGCRVDFLLWFQCGKSVGGVAIECDGHAFHERTKEQAARDKDRDRKILLSGFPVMRFTGSEIFRDTGACVEQVRSALVPILNRVSREGGLFS